jgi:hypothetical protein
MIGGWGDGGRGGRGDKENNSSFSPLPHSPTPPLSLPMKHVKCKTLAFYALTIVPVLVLFKAVTAYGESNLKAPPK